MILDNNKNIFLALLYFLCVAALAALVYQLARENVSLENVYEDTSLVFKTTGDGISNKTGYARREDDDGKFVFAAGAPATTKAKLVFHKTADIRFKVSSLYEGTVMHGSRKQ